MLDSFRKRIPEAAFRALENAVNKDRAPADEAINNIRDQISKKTISKVNNLSSKHLYAEEGKIYKMLSKNILSLYDNVYKTNAPTCCTATITTMATMDTFHGR